MKCRFVSGVLRVQCGGCTCVRYTWNERRCKRGMERDYVGIVRTWDRPYSGGGCVRE